MYLADRRSLFAFWEQQLQQQGSSSGAGNSSSSKSGFDMAKAMQGSKPVMLYTGEKAKQNPGH
jgi:hypothetical protein